MELTIARAVQHEITLLEGWAFLANNSGKTSRTGYDEYDARGDSSSTDKYS